jgi:excisionase family DNA binding protein
MSELVVLALPGGGAGAFPMAQVIEARVRAAAMGFGAEAAAVTTVNVEERWLDSRQLSKLTGIGDTTLEGLANRGQVPCLRAGKLLRFKLSEVERALKARNES